MLLLRISGRKNTDKWLPLAGIAAAAIVVFAGFMLARHTVNDPDSVFLSPHGTSTWIRFPEPMKLHGQPVREVSTVFRTRFHVSDMPDEATLHFRAFRQATLWVDGVCIHKGDAPGAHWNTEVCLDLLPYIRPGPHTLLVRVRNTGGPPALIAWCGRLGISTSRQWEASYDGRAWRAALPAGRTIPPAMYHAFQRADQAFVSSLSLLVPVFLVACVLGGTYLARTDPRNSRETVLSAAAMRWFILAAWIVLSMNNVGRLPFYLGMDINGHLEYIEYIAHNRHLPLASTGWTMFEPPLFYTVSALLYAFFVRFFSLEAVYGILRVIPLLCGLIQIEACYRVLRVVYPDRDDIQVLGTLMGGLLPVNIYMSQFVGTEPLSGCLSAMVVLLAVRLLHSETAQPRRLLLVMGTLLGLSLLAKITAFLLVPPLVLFVSLSLSRKEQDTGRRIIAAGRGIGLVLGMACAVAGWYFLRNYLNLGQFVIGASGGGFSSGYVGWWQDPGYRTLSHFLWSGKSLVQPIYSGVFSVWDSLYSTMWADGYLSGIMGYARRPPWNYGLMIAGVWLSLLPFAAMTVGLAAALKNSVREPLTGRTFAALCVMVFLAAIVFQYLRVPIYAIAKAKYALGVLPCLALLGASGLEVMTRRRALKPVIWGLMACWSVCSYGAFLVWEVPDDMQARNHYYLANVLVKQEKLNEAAGQYLEALMLSPESIPVDPGMILAFRKAASDDMDSGEYDDAMTYLKRLKDLQPDDPDHYYNIACAYARQYKVEDAVYWLRQAIERGFRNRELIMKDPDLDNIRNHSYVQGIMMQRERI